MKSPIPLLPCPWCGSANVGPGSRVSFDDLELDCNYDAIRCYEESCGAMGPVFHQDEASAIAGWNKGPYADRLQAHSEALRAHAQALIDKAAEHMQKADELLAKAKAAEGGEAKP